MVLQAKIRENAVFKCKGWKDVQRCIGWRESPASFCLSLISGRRGVCVCVCVCERERVREREKDRDRKS